MCRIRSVSFLILVISFGFGGPAAAAGDASLESFSIERYSSLGAAERSSHVDADLRRHFPPGVQLADVVAELRGLGANCEHAKAGVVAEFGTAGTPEGVEEYACKHEKKIGGLKKQTTNVTILFNSKSCAVTDYKVSAGTSFGFSVGKSVAVGGKRAAHCFAKE